MAGGRPGVLRLAAVVGVAPVAAAASSSTLPPVARLLASLPAAELLATLKLALTLGAVRFSTAAAACVLGGSTTDATLRALPTVDAAAADAWTLSTLVTDAARAVADTAGVSFPSADGAVRGLPRWLQGLRRSRRARPPLLRGCSTGSEP